MHASISLETHMEGVRGYLVLRVWAWSVQEQRPPLESKARAHWGFEKVSECGWKWRKRGQVAKSLWTFEEEEVYRGRWLQIQGRRSEAWTAPLAIERPCQSVSIVLEMVLSLPTLSEF